MTIPPISTFPNEEAIDLLFETSPVLMQRISELPRPISYSELISTFQTDVLPSLTWQEKVDVVNAHPRIGEAKRVLSTLSFAEQGYSKANVDDEEVNEKLRELNILYEEKHGFKFVMFVNGRPRRSIIPLMEEAISQDKETEMERGLRDMCDIARDRLKKLEP